MTNYTIVTNNIIDDNNLKYDEKMLFIGLVRYNNDKYGYAFPKYEELLSIMGTKRREKIKTTLDKLVEKGYIRIEKVGRNNRYYIIKSYSVDEVIQEPKVETVKQSKPVRVDSNGNAPLDGQIEVEEIITEDHEEKIKLVKNKIKFLAIDQIELLKKYDIEDIKRVINSADKINFKYLLNGLEMKIKTPFDTANRNDETYDALERQLMGWGSVDDITSDNVRINNYTSNNSKRLRNSY